MAQFYDTPRQALPCSAGLSKKLNSGIPVGRHELTGLLAEGIGKDFLIARRFFDGDGGSWVVQTKNGWRLATGRELWVLVQVWRSRLSKAALEALEKKGPTPNAG